TFTVSAALIFIASRIVVLAGVGIGTFVPRAADNPDKIDFGTAWYFKLLRWDSGWYARIVDEGYRAGDIAGDANSTVFYPVFPLIASAVKTVLGVASFLAVLLTANAAAFAAALLMAKYVKDEFGEEVALWSLAFLCLFPTAVFLSSAYTEPLFLMFA